MQHWEISLIATRTIDVYGLERQDRRPFWSKESNFFKGVQYLSTLCTQSSFTTASFPTPACKFSTHRRAKIHPRNIAKARKQMTKKEKTGRNGRKAAALSSNQKMPSLSLSHTHCHRKSEFLAHPSHNTLTQLVIQPPQISHVHTTFSTAAHRDNGWSVMSVQKHREAWGSTGGQGLETPILWPQLMHPYTSLPLSLALPPFPAWPLWEKDRVGYLHTCSVLQCYKQHAP